jgi:hypothetical protein
MGGTSLQHVGRGAPELILASQCDSCRAALAVEDQFCRRCGAATAARLAPATLRETKLVPARLSILENRAAVIAIILVAGPLGLPCLWFSGRFSRATKIIATIVYFALTVVAPIAITWYWLDVAVRPLLDVWARKP